MKKLINIVVNLLIALSLFPQKAYLIASLKGEFSGISHSQSYQKGEFKPSIPTFSGLWKIEMAFSSQKITHKISIEQSMLGKNFRITNKFKAPPNVNILGFNYIGLTTGIDHLVFGYSLQKESRKEKGFLFRSRIRFNYSAGIGVSFNRSNDYYRDYYSSSSGGIQDNYTYVGYEITHHKSGMGLFLKGTGGFDFINKRGKRYLDFSIFFNQGLKNMVQYNIHYQYGYWNDASKQVDVPNQQLFSKGTTFGFNLGVPITIKK